MAMVQKHAVLAPTPSPEETQQPEVERATAGDAPALASVFRDAFAATDDALVRMFPPGVGDEYQRRAWARFVRWGEPPRPAGTTAGSQDGCEADDGVVNVDGLESDEKLQLLQQHGDRSIKADECNVFVIRDDAAGQGGVQSAALVWVIGPGDGGVRPWRQRWPPAAPGMAAAEWVSFQRGMAAQHDAAMGSEPHVYLEIIMTHSSARRRGHASALLRAACAAADRRRCPLYLDAQPAAMGLYARHGFAPRDDLRGAGAADQATPTCPMVRPPPRRSFV
ncbi:acetyltransferase (GNAT) domain-containing protein [Hirsutella rhossiliensis]|uniref:Acetyltransferase (GNAT) domain-containing protein n=1 Tax=Hirsutella rhossiliensis TaxID=111463 RepID=A0A9P8N2B0_9HYPO|nr:acetyltransferase (GNAT) domain-containing protein [Hirsutella rhossiliensis]KAH0966358.1 acetyltransferase (GNAT) domain-containing protein [Hirsutella rhossiliensis]